MTDDTQKQLSIGGENVTHPQPENCAPPIVGDRQTEIQGDGPRASKSADHGPQDDTQKRIDWIKATRRTVLEGGTVAMFEAQAMVENDIPWLLEQIDEANKFRWFAASWTERLEQLLDARGIKNEIFGDIGPCTPADAPKGYVRAEHLYRALSKRDAEIARLKEALAMSRDRALAFGDALARERGIADELTQAGLKEIARLKNDCQLCGCVGGGPICTGCA